MKTLLVASLLLLATPQQVGPPKSEWIVIFNHVVAEAPPVTINIRLIVQARSEGDAVLTSMKQLRKIVDDRTCDALMFVECQERK
jgi:hypothetical protein